MWLKVAAECRGRLARLCGTSERGLLVRVSDAVKNIVDFLGLQVCERSDKVPEGKSAHTLYLAGVFRGGHDVLVRCKLAATTDSGVTMQMTVRSTDANVSQVITAAIA